ncbi:hypothetical protein NP493_2621g00003 [Ridgeia piscesae]|uniref:HEAT repeat-containing protein 1 n=1 Tax=Ridgeia piscesae TaxID=27915 RepID=A0AAD9JE14_RIDPI|nr:hypothetical protein NP493_2621g00003 [Ridgeia piscesae]
MVMVLMMESAVRSKNIPTVSEDAIVDEMQKTTSRIDQDIEFMAQICEQFPASNQMRACTHVMAFLQKLSLRNEQGSRARKGEPLELIHTDTLTAQQLRQLQMHMTRLVAVLLSCESFATQILTTYTKKTETDQVDEFSAFVRECLCYLTAVTRNQGAVSGLDPSVVKFWKSMLHKVYDILDKVNYLLPTSVFLEVVSTLMQHSLVGVRRKALELLNRRLQQLQPSELSNTEVGLVQLQPSELSNTEVGLVQLQPSELSNTEVGLVQLQPSELSNTEVGLVQLQPSELSNTEVGLVQLQPSELSNTEVGLVQLQPSALSNTEVGLVQLQPSALSNTEVGLVSSSLVHSPTRR